MTATTVQAYQCPICKGLHLTLKNMQSCQKKCKKELAALEDETAKAARLAKERQDFLDLMNYPRLNATSIPHLIELCKEVALKAWNVELNFALDVAYNEQASCSHSAPVGKPTNWGGQDKKSPTSYVGLTGSIKGTSKHLTVVPKKDTWRQSSGSDFFKGFGRGIIGINTGSGSGGDVFQFSVTLFLDDFPLIKANYEKYQQMKQDACADIDVIEAKLEQDIASDAEVGRLTSQFEYLTIIADKAKADADAASIALNVYCSSKYRSAAYIKIQDIRDNVQKFKNEQLGFKFRNY